jgi:hypothetical protein
LDCRLGGRDCEIQVGKPLPGGEGVVVAILDHGREEVFDVHTTAGSEMSYASGATCTR